MTNEESSREVELVISESARKVLRTAIHLHEKTGHYLYPDVVARAAHELYGCVTPESTWETMDECEETQDEIETILSAIVGMDNVRAFEAREGHEAIREAARSVVGVE